MKAERRIIVVDVHLTTALNNALSLALKQITRLSKRCTLSPVEYRRIARLHKLVVKTRGYVQQSARNGGR